MAGHGKTMALCTMILPSIKSRKQGRRQKGETEGRYNARIAGGPSLPRDKDRSDETRNCSLQILPCEYVLPSTISFNHRDTELHCNVLHERKRSLSSRSMGVARKLD